MSYAINTDRMKLARLEKGYSQAALAQKSGVTLVTVCLLETKKTKTPRPSTIKKICDALGIAVTDVLVAVE